MAMRSPDVESRSAVLLDDALEAVIAATGADSGSIQLVDHATGALEIVAQKGFGTELLAFLRSTHHDVAACGAAMAQRARVVVEDVEVDPLFREPGIQAVMRRAGIRAVDSTPLLGRSGQLLGVLSTHFRTPHRPSERELRLVDVFARAVTEIERDRAEIEFRDVIDSAPDPIFGVDGRGRILFVNKQTEKVFGYAPTELVGQSIELLVPSRLREKHEVLRAGYVRSPNTRPMGAGLDLRARRQDGSELPVEISLSPLAGTNGPLTIAIVRDVTERQRAQETIRERERTFRAIFNATFQFIGLVSPDGILLEANQSLVDLGGRGVDEILGRPLWEMPWWAHSPELQARVKEAVGSAAQGRFVRFEASHARPDRSVAVVDFSLKPVRDDGGNIVLLVKEGRDISDRARAEIERERLLGVAEEARAQAEDHLRRRAEAERMKDDLINMVVHDLKNPVSGITMMIQAALRRRDDLPARHRDTLLRIDLTCREMMRLVQNVLEIGKMEEGKMPVAREPVVLAELVDQVVREYTSVAEQTGRSLQAAVGPDLPAVTADHGLLKRVLVNLVVNALRHSGSKDVRIESAPFSGDGEIVIRVVDHGHGIPEEDHARIFEKFASMRRGPSGEPGTDTGLGLPFCKLAVERMGGRIALTSTTGAGTVFAVSLPVHAAPA